VTDPARRPGPRRALSRPQYLFATAILALAGMALLTVLGAVFGREDQALDRGPRTSLSFDSSDGAATDLDAVSGRIEVRDGEARATRASAADPAVALIDRGSNEGRLTVTAAAPGPGWGVVVRWEDAAHHWFASVPAGGGPLQVGYRAGGAPKVVTEASQPLAPGASVDVRFDENRVDVRIDGELVASARGREVAGPSVGLRATEPRVAWDDLAVGSRPRPHVRPDG